MLDSISAKALPKISEFKEQGLANTAWALCVLCDRHRLQDFVVPAAKLFQELTPCTQGVMWVDFVTAARQACSDDGVEMNGLFNVFDSMVWRPMLDGLASLASREHLLAMALRSFREAVDVIGVAHLGPLYTRDALRALRLSGHISEEEAVQWAKTARMSIREAVGSSWLPPSTEGVVALASLNVVGGCGGGDRLEIPARIFCGNSGGGVGTLGEAAMLFESIDRHVARDGHCERVCICWLADAMIAHFGANAWGACVGQLLIYASHFPCISCIAVLCQFRRYVPRVKAHVDYDSLWESWRVERGACAEWEPPQFSS